MRWAIIDGGRECIRAAYWRFMSHREYTPNALTRASHERFITFIEEIE